MNTRNEITALAEEFTRCFPDAAEDVAAFKSFVSKNDRAGLFDRKNPVGHLTVSALVCDREMKNVLLLFHRQLQRWLQPGGHIERDDMTLIGAALREVEEELGIAPEGLYVMSMPNGFSVVNIDSHRIPANVAKGEPPHFHHDVRFILRLKNDSCDVCIAEREAVASKWIPVGEYAKDHSMSHVTERFGFFTESRDAEAFVR